MPPKPNSRRPVKVPGHPGIFHKGSTYIDTWKDRGKPKSRSYPTLTAAVRGRAQRIASGNQPASRERFDRYAPRWIEDTAAAPSTAWRRTPARSTARSSTSG